MSEDWKDVVADWRGDRGFVGSNSSGSEVQLGTVDGQQGVSPMEFLLLGLAGCTGVDVVMILEKKRKKLHNFKVRVRGRRAEQHPRVYEEIEVEYLFWGDDLDPKAVEQAIQLSEEKYCSASNMLGAVAEIRSQYHINPPDANIE